MQQRTPGGRTGFCNYPLSTLVVSAVPARRIHPSSNYVILVILELLSLQMSGGSDILAGVLARFRWSRRKIRREEGKVKCRHLKKLTYKGTLRQMFICLRPRTLYPPPPPYTLHTCTVYGLLFHTGKGGGGRVEPERRSEGQ